MKERPGEDIFRRLRKYGGQILIFSAQLPSTPEGRHVRVQLLKSGTAPGAHYSEARGAQSADDFIHKVSLALKEARESLYWIGVSREAGYETKGATWLETEGGELVAILAASKATAQKRRGQKPQRRQGS